MINHSSTTKDITSLLQKIIFSFLFVSILILFILNIFFGKNSILLAVLLLMAIVIYKIQDRDKELAVSEEISTVYIRTFCLLLQLLFYTLLGLTALIVYFYGRENYIYSSMIILMALVVFGQCFLIEENGKSILGIICQIIILSLIIKLSIIYGSISILGNDTWEHAKIVKQLIESGYINNKTFLNSNYNYFPNMHILVALSKLILDLTLKNSLTIISIILSLSAIFIYLIGKHYFNYKIGLLSALFVATNDEFIKWSTTQIIPMTLGVALFIAFIYIIIKAKEESKFNIILLSILIFVSILLTHMIATFVAVITVFGFFLGNLIHDLINKQALSKNKYLFSMLLIGVIMLFHWIYVSNFIDYIRVGLNIDNLINSFTHREIVMSLNVGDFISILDSIPQLLVYSLLSLGIIWICNRNIFTEKRFIYAFGVGILVCIVFLMSLINNISLLPYRWYIYLNILALPICIMGLVKFKKYNLYNIIFIVFISIIYVGLNIIGPIANDGTALYYPYGYTNNGGLNQAEIDAANWSYGHVPNKLYSYNTKGVAFNGVIYTAESKLLKNSGILITDLPYSGYIARYLGVTCAEISPIADLNGFRKESGIVLLRSYILNHNAYGITTLIRNQYFQGIIPPRPNLKKQIDGDKLNEIYDSSYVWAYKA